MHTFGTFVHFRQILYTPAYSCTFLHFLQILVLLQCFRTTTSCTVLSFLPRSARGESGHCSGQVHTIPIPCPRRAWTWYGQGIGMVWAKCRRCVGKAWVNVGTPWAGVGTPWAKRGWAWAFRGQSVGTAWAHRG